MGITEKSAILAWALATLPVAIAAWATQSRVLFAFGAIGAVLGLFLAPVMTLDWEPSATERDRIMASTAFNMPGTILGAVAGALAGWWNCCRKYELPTDDWGRR